ncbi:succinate semialdehyde dehydrogenase NADP+ linked [Lunasporangiospora selenospora]|uniref:succinate-semialdehyde dehydrogenase [NAD(P)(+)] n=1 Tax=Lunasporangiospora selenospora TaxID=979761 RepID=A0A9P6G0N4_9FUNG|nr:succinate semialdehyde dehydrogenase NADP+ linked [Lunasporangiospora selenospora]
MIRTCLTAAVAVALGLLSIAHSSPVNIFEKPTLQKRSSAHIIRECTVPGSFAVTFDDGPSAWTHELLDYLKIRGTKATFFVNGLNYNLITDPEFSAVVKRTFDEGHQIGSHTWGHMSLAQPTTDVSSQMRQLDDALLKIIGVRPVYMRPPYGETSPSALQWLGDNGYKVVNWNVDSRDWQHPLDFKSDFEGYRLALQNPAASSKGYISLQHDAEQATAEAFGMLAIEYVLSKGAKIMTVGECLNANLRLMSSLNNTIGNLELKDPAGFLNNKFVTNARSGQRFSIFDPARGSEIATCPDMNVEEVEEAIQAAKKALPEWGQKTARERSVILRKWYELMLENEMDLAKILTWENGKPLAEALGEIRYGAQFFEWFAEEAKRLYGEIIPSPAQNQRMIVIRQPLGVVGVITPWNFPSAMLTRKFGAALAVGCTVVTKPAAETPLSCLALCELGRRAGLPEGVIGVVTTHAHTKAVGKHLCESRDVSGISFTGSTAVGKILLKQSADTVKKMSLELGGNAPFIVFEDADIDKAVDAAILSKFRNSGQTCISVNRLYVHSSIKDEFGERMRAKVAKFNMGSGFDKGTTHGPLITEAAVQKVHLHVEDALKQGAKALVGGDFDDKDSAASRIGYFYPPTVLTDMKNHMRIANEETFGPVAGIFTFETEEEAIELANSTRMGLAGYFFSKDMSRCWRVAEKMQVGMVGVNNSAISSEVAPFGGVKESGLGREGARQGLEEYTQYKYINMGI